MKWYLTLPLVATLAFSGCDLLSSKEGSAKANAHKQRPAAPVDVIIAKPENIAMSFTYPARLQSPQSVVLLPKVSASIVSQKFKAGDKVKKGTVLFELDPDMYEAQAASSRAAANSAEAEFKRISALFKKGASSQKEMDNAKANRDSTKAALKIAELNLSYTKVTAPFSGTLSDKLADVGSFAAANSTPLVRLTRTDEIDAVYYISDVDALERTQRLADGTWSLANKNITLNLAGKTYEGEIRFVDSIIDPNTGTLLAKASFKNENGELLPGAVGSVSLSGFTQVGGFKVPQIAVLQDALGAYVLLVKDGKAYKQNINIAYQTPEYVVVNSGLKEGDMIIMDNFRKIAAGAPVAPQEASQTQDAQQKAAK